MDLSLGVTGWGTIRARRSVEGKPLRIGGKGYERGVGTHAQGVFDIRLDGKARRFTARVGVDDEVPAGKGSVEFVVKVDGEALFKSGTMRSGDAAREAEVDLSGARNLVLLTDTAGDGNGWDHADWADARFTLAGGDPALVDETADPRANELAGPEAAGGGTDAQGLPPADALQSFEEGVPAHVAALKGKLSRSERYAQDGRHSLRWDWVAGDRLTIRTGPLGDINVWTGYGRYSRSAMEVRIYNETVSDSRLTFRWLARDGQGGTFEFPLHVEGWQRVCYHYSWNSGIRDRNAKHLAATDRIVIDAPAGGAGGTVYLDALIVNKPFDFREKGHPVEKAWRPCDIAEYPDKSVLADPTPEELAAVEGFLPRRTGTGATTEAEVAALEERMAKRYEFRRLEDGHLVGRSAGWKEITPDMLAAAELWRRTGDDALARRVEEVYFMLDDHFRTLGAVAQGSIGGLNNYIGRTHGDACFLMREPLLRTGRLKRVRDCLKYNYSYAQIFEGGRMSRSMDFHYNEVRYLFKIALMHDTPEEIVPHLRVFKRAYDRQVIDTIKPDGSLYHHGAHYFAYAGGAMMSTADTFERTLGTPFQPGREAFEAFRRAVMNMRFYSNERDLPVTLHGRHPGRQQLNPDLFRRLALISARYNEEKPDLRIAAAYLRFRPQDRDSAPFKGLGVGPEQGPEGNLAMNYAGLMGHRRGQWLAMVRGYGAHYWAQESYGNQNRHGLSMGNGCLDILATGDPVNLLDSGCVIAEGWDWRHFDGSTAIHMPYKQLANGNATLSERSGVTFVGGLSHLGRNGVFVMPIRSSLQYGKAMDEGQTRPKDELFSADKSWFFFDDRIVCLGAGIRAAEVHHPVRTTLSQKHLKRPDMPIHVDGRAVTSLPFEEALSDAKAHTLLDIQGTGYFVPAGQTVHVARRLQRSRDGHDTKDTEGNHAVAWVEHGASPRDGAYEYVILVGTTPRDLAAFADAMRGDEEERPVRVLKDDEHAHVVRDAATRSTGHVIFKAGDVPGPVAQRSSPSVLNASRPCLVMIEDVVRGRLRLTVCDPDLNLKDGLSRPRELSVKLSGAWRVASGPASAAVDGDGNTRLTVETVDGRSYDLVLEPAGASE